MALGPNGAPAPGAGRRLAPFLDAPDRAAVITDFDGTLAPIVDDPAAAVPLPGTVEVLHRLAQRFACVAVVSGRPVEFLRARLELDERPPSKLVISGLYGLERLDGHGASVHPGARAWAPAVAETAQRAEAEAPAGVGIERKGYSVALHVRTSPHLAEWARSWAESAAASTGLALHGGRMSWELRPPVPVDKGTVVAELVATMAAACFLGDDVGDLAAFEALDGLAAGGEAATAVRVAVRSPEAPADLLERADVVVDGPPGALRFLEGLLGSSPAT